MINGMVGWSKVMTPAQIETIGHYVIRRANEDKVPGEKLGGGPSTGAG